MVIWSYICLSMICSEVPIISDELHLKRGIWSTTPLADPRLANASEVFETATGCDFHQWRPGWIAKSMAKSRKTEKFSRDEHCKTARPDDFPRDVRDFSCDSFKGNPVGPVKFNLEGYVQVQKNWDMVSISPIEKSLMDMISPTSQNDQRRFFGKRALHPAGCHMMIFKGGTSSTSTVRPKKLCFPTIETDSFGVSQPWLLWMGSHSHR